MSNEPAELPPEVAAALQQLDHIMQMITRHPDEDVQEAVVALLQAVDILHRGGLQRLRALLDARSLMEEAVAEPHVALLFDLYRSEHDGDLRAGAEAAVAAIRADVEAQGGQIEIATAEGGVVNVRLLAATNDPAAAAALRRLVEESLRAELPELVRIDMSPQTTSVPGPAHAEGVLIPLTSIKRRVRPGASHDAGAPRLDDRVDSG